MALLNPGEFVTCENGHVIAKVVKALNIGDRGWADCIGHWRIEHPPIIGAPVPMCPCGAPFVRGGGYFHIEGRGWVPPLPAS